ncbi:MAG: TonB-dependent receptor plug domain-containing protein [Acidobacteriota bacterium]
MAPVRFLVIAGSLLLCAAGVPSSWGEPPSTAPQDLKSLSLEQLGNVKVTTVSKEPEEVWQTPAAIYVLTQDDIRRSGATTLPDLLRMVPGVEVAEMQSNQWAVGIRGFGSQFSRGVLLLIDGRSAYTELFEGVYWDVQDFPLYDIERIEIIRGPGGTIWGANAVNGVINIITKDSSKTQGVLASALSGRVDRFNGTLRAGWRHGDHLTYNLFAHGLVREPELDPHSDGYDHWDLSHGGFRADWTPTFNNQVTVQGDLYMGHSGQQVGVGYYHPLMQASVDGTQAVSGGDVLLHWDHQFENRSDARFQAYFDRTNRQGPQFGETRNTIDFDFIHHIAAHRQDFIWGAGARLSPSYFIMTQPTVDFLPHQQTDYIYSLFGQDTIHLIPSTLSLELGTKLEYNNFSRFEYQPDVRLLWNPAAHATLWAGIQRAVRTPGRLDQDLKLTGVGSSNPPLLVRIEGDPFFQSEVLIGEEAGYRQLLTDKLFVDVAAFHNRYEKLEGYGNPSVAAITTPVPALLITVPYANAIDGNTDGVEIAPDWKPTSWWDLKGNYSYLHLKTQPRPAYAGAVDNSYAATYNGSSPHRESALQSYFGLARNLELDLDVRYVSRLPAQSVRDYTTADAHVSWEPHKHWRIFVAGRNLLQPAHQEFTGNNGNPVGIRREVFGGVTWMPSK